MFLIAVNKECTYIDDNLMKLLAGNDYEVRYMDHAELVGDDTGKILLLIIDIDTVTLNELYVYVRFAKRNNIAIAVCTEDPDHIELPLLFRHELEGYLLKESNTDRFAQKVQCLRCDNSYIDEAIVPALFRDYIRITKHALDRPQQLLTDREWEILELIVQGKSTSEMSEELSISKKTVTNHVAAILQKLKVDDRINAALLAVKNKWIIL